MSGCIMREPYSRCLLGHSQLYDAGVPDLAASLLTSVQGAITNCHKPYYVQDTPGITLTKTARAAVTQATGSSTAVKVVYLSMALNPPIPS